jgi:uncharacterized protein (TIGR02453 family)
MVSRRFEGFRPEAVQFMADLAAHNDRAWFTPRKPDFERLLRAPLEALCLDLADRLAERGVPLQADPKRSPFRIYRDTRFSRDKSPYKSHLGASFPWLEGLPAATIAAHGAHASGGYFHFQPGEMYVGGGLWMPEKARLEAFRTAVRDEPERVRSALEEPRFVAWFGGARSHDTLRRSPKGWPVDHPLADLFRWQDCVFGRPLSDADVASPELPDLLAEGFEAAVPVFRFLASLEVGAPAGRSSDAV